jgi:hypothetical protein
MNDTPHIVDFNGTRFAVTRLKNGTQALICEEAAKITKQENMAFGDIMKQFAVNMPSIAKVITFALLNDKCRIFNDGSAANGYTKEFEATYNTLMWDVTNNNGIIEILMEILKMIDISFFLTSSEVVKTMRNAMTKAIPQLKS